MSKFRQTFRKPKPEPKSVTHPAHPQRSIHHGLWTFSSFSLHPAHEELLFVHRPQPSFREDARAAVPDQQMRPAPRYPVDRYLVESSKKFEIVNIMDEEIWHHEPALRPEDEMILRKLHDMLQSTADDLKTLSGELNKFHQPGVQVKSQPTPLDEEFNEKVHIEEIVNAKFHGHKIIDKPTRLPLKKDVNEIKPVVNSDRLKKPNISTGTQVNSAPVKKGTVNKNLVITRPKVIEIWEGKDGTSNKLNNGKVIKNMPAVAYNEFSFKYVEPKNKFQPLKSLQVQHMPKINIRSELKEQKVLHLDIIPESKASADNTTSKTNVAVISVDYDVDSKPTQITDGVHSVNYPHTSSINRQTSRKVSKMSTYESSASTNNSDTQHHVNTQKLIKNVIRSSPRNSARIIKGKKMTVSKKEPETRSHLNLDEWKRKLDLIYGQPSTSKPSKSNLKPGKKVLHKKANTTSCGGQNKPTSKILNNAEYIPYAHLTLGGARVSDVEREISEIPNKNNVPLSPILDKILSSKENSPRKIKKPKKKGSQNVFTTSDENLLEEVLDIEKSVSETISKNFIQSNKDKTKIQKVSSDSSEVKENDSYADDFEDEKSDDSHSSDQKPKSSGPQSKQGSTDHSDANSGNESDDDNNQNNKGQNIQNSTFTKAVNLSFKESVDVFEFVHAVDTQETATQSNTTNKISLKETQTSPRNDRPNIQPIHNDLWPSIDPNGDVEKMFKLEKDFIKKLILEEYGDLLEKNITKPSTSKDSQEPKHKDKNVAANQKNTQTSPAHVKSVMTSPTRTKTRTTSPFLTVTVDHQTSPMIIVSNEEKVRLEIDDDEDGISINLSSPRFSLRLPQTSREVLSNLEMSNASVKGEKGRAPSKTDKSANKTYRRTSSSSSIDDDNSSSEISSLGEIKLKLKRRLTKRAQNNTDSDSSSTVSKYSSEAPSGGILPLKSEGELSLSQGRRKFYKSDGETSFGQTK